MPKQIISAGSVSANYHIHVRQSLARHTSVSAGLANESTFHIPLYTQNGGFYIHGTFGSGSASTTIAIDKGVSANGPYLNLLSISAPMFTAIPIFADEVIRVRHTWSSAAAAITNASVNVWIA